MRATLEISGLRETKTIAFILRRSVKKERQGVEIATVSARSATDLLKQTQTFPEDPLSRMSAASGVSSSCSDKCCRERRAPCKSNDEIRTFGRRSLTAGPENRGSKSHRNLFSCSPPASSEPASHGRRSTNVAVVWMDQEYPRDRGWCVQGQCPGIQ
jgi:hypothetical protein